MATTGLALLPCTQYSALHTTAGICNSKVQKQLAVLEWGKPASLTLSYARAFGWSCFLWLNECWSWLPCCANWPSYANSNNSSSGQPFWTLPTTNHCSRLYLLCISGYIRFVPKIRFWWNPSHDFSRAPKEANKLLSTHLTLGYAFPHCCISHDGTNAKKAQCLPRGCENHKLCFSSLFFNVSNLGAQCVPWSKSGFTTFGWT